MSNRPETKPRTPRTRTALAAAALLLAPLAARPATESTTFAVSATVVSTCGIAASPLAFGVYAMGQTDSTTTVAVTCTSGTAYSVSLSAGGGAGATVGSRKLTGPATQTLDYTLYRDAGRTIVWGDSIGSDTVSGVGSGLLQSLTVYGRIPAAQGTGAGAYADTITVTLTY